MPSPKPDPPLAAAIRRLRERRGITREALAYRAGITVGALARIELAQAAPRWDTVSCLVAALGLSLAQLAHAVEVSATAVAPASPSSQ